MECVFAYKYNFRISTEPLSFDDPTNSTEQIRRWEADSRASGQ
jgi:hypothetical protein